MSEIPPDPIQPERWPPQPQRPEFTLTGRFKRELGTGWPAWVWLSKQFSATSLGLIGALLVTAAGYLLRLDTRMMAQQTQIEVLKARMPTGEAIAHMADDLSHVRESVGVLTQRIDSQGEALERISGRFDLDYIDTMKPLSKRKLK